MPGNTFPEVRDTSSLTGIFNVDQFMSIGVEGQMDNAGTGVALTPVVVSTATQSDTVFGPNSSLGLLVKFVLARGINFVTAVASKKGSAPVLSDRQAAWAVLEDDPTIRIRLTDSAVQADLVALADSCENAEGIQNKQFCFGALASPTTKGNAEALSAAMASKRGVAVGPGIYDLNGNLLSGKYAAAYAACEVAKNPDIVDSLNDVDVPATAGIEKDSTGVMPLFRLRANAGSPVNDFQDLLDAGFSPFMQSRTGRASLTHLRTTYTADDTYDALMTLLIKDEVFLQLRDVLRDQKFLRTGNTPTNRALAGKIVDSWLRGHQDWVQPVELPNGVEGYGVSVTPSTDLKQITVSYHGEVVRGNNVINIAAALTIPV